jgi:large subunit ribosomal protein L3
MGHRKHNAPRRGSLAFSPRARHQVFVPRVRNWTTHGVDRPMISGFPAFKAGMIQAITIDDRERTPNFGRPMFNAATVLVAPPVTVCAFRAYGEKDGRKFAVGDVFAENLDEVLRERIGCLKNTDAEHRIQELSKQLDNVTSFAALIAVSPSEGGLSNSIPQVQEVYVAGGDKKGQLEYLKSVLGKQVKCSDLFKAGGYVDAIAVTKGKGFEGPVTRFGVKRKQHKSRKSVRAVGVISPWHPATVMYTVARAGQMGFHQRIMKNNRILVIGSAPQSPVTPTGGYLHFGEVKGDYLIVRGSIPGPTKRLVDLRLPIYPKKQKVTPPRIVELNAGGTTFQIAQARPLSSTK